MVERTSHVRIELIEALQNLRNALRREGIVLRPFRRERPGACWPGRNFWVGLDPLRDPRAFVPSCLRWLARNYAAYHQCFFRDERQSYQKQFEAFCLCCDLQLENHRDLS